VPLTDLLWTQPPGIERRLPCTGVAFALVGATWWQLFTAVALGVQPTQVAFLGHDTGHKQVARTTRVSYLMGLPLGDLGIGLSCGWLLDKHNGRVVDLLLGGLNYQVEHHLFPSMPRPNLRRAQRLVAEFCAERRVRYVETGLFDSYRQVLGHLHDIPSRAALPGGVGA
jgi:fatty acid desaturase